jgi:hypothetical protein
LKERAGRKRLQKRKQAETTLIVNKDGRKMLYYPRGRYTYDPEQRRFHVDNKK